MGYEHIAVPADGAKITLAGDGTLNVPDHPIIPFTFAVCRLKCG